MDAFAPLRGRMRSADLTIASTGSRRTVGVAASVLRRSKGLFFTRSQSLLIVPCSSVHSIGMTRTLEVAYLDAGGAVLQIRMLPPWRMHAPVKGARAALEMSPGMFEDWGLRVGDELTVEPR